MDRLDNRIRRTGQESVDEIGPRDRFGLGAAASLERGPDPCEGEQRSLRSHTTGKDLRGKVQLRVATECGARPRTSVQTSADP
jgi:hypothetical protein